MARTLEVRIVLRASQFKTGLTGAANQLQKFGVTVSQQTGKAAQSAQALGLASAVAGKLILLGIGGAMVVSAKAAIDFESSLTSVAKTTDLAGQAFDKAGTPLKVFGEAIRNLALRVPVNVNDLNQIAALGGQLGIATPNLISFTDTVARLGVSTNLGIEEAATGLARFANIMGTNQTEFDRLGSIMVELGNNFATTEAEILHFGLRIAPVAKAVGATEDEVFALSAAMTSLGIPAERGGTAIQRLFIQMASAVDAGGEALGKFGRVAGITGEEFASLFQESPARAFQAFVQGLDGINQSGESVFGTLRELDIQEQRTIQVLLASASGWRTVKDAIDTAAAENEEVNALQEESARRFGTTASQLEILGNSFRDLQIELGGAILGSGGLAGAIDVMREFFQLIKDNKDEVGRIAAALAVLAGLRLAVGLGAITEKLMGFVKQVKMIPGAASQAAQGMTRMQAAASLVNLAIGAAALGIGILVAKWIDASIKAAELRGRVRALNQAIADGEDPMLAYVNLLKEANILSEDRRGILTQLGIDEKDLAADMLAGGDGTRFLTDELKAQYDEVQRLIEAGGGLEAPQLGFLAAFRDPQRKQMEEFIRLLAAMRVEADGFFKIKTNDLVNSLFDTGQAVEKTDREMRRLADRAIHLFGPGVTNEQFQSFVDAVDHGRVVGSKSVRDFWHGPRGVVEETKKGVQTFSAAMFAAGPEGEKAMDDFFDNIQESAVKGQEEIEQAMTDIRDALIGGMPTDSEYKQMAELTKEGLEKITAAQTAYVEDQMAFAVLLRAIRGTVSQETLDWLLAQPSTMQGALGRLFQTNKPLLDQFIANTEEKFGELGTVIGDRAEEAFPTAAKGVVGKMAATLYGEVVGAKEAFNLSGEEVTDQLIQGVMEYMEILAPGSEEEFITLLTQMFGDPDTWEALGMDVSDPLVVGFLKTLGTLSERAKAVIERQAALVMSHFNHGYRSESPSKLTMEVGDDLGQGLLIGLENSLKDFDPLTMRMRGSRADQLPPIEIRGGGGGDTSYARNSNVIINNPTTRNLREDVQLISIYGGLAESVEGVRV